MEAENNKSKQLEVKPMFQKRNDVTSFENQNEDKSNFLLLWIL